MDIHAGIIDQFVRGLAQRRKDRIEEALGRTLDETTTRSVAFVVLCVKTMLDLSEDEALDTITEGGNDFGVDAIVVGDLVDGEFTVTLFQGKYNHANLDGSKGFPQSGVEKAVQAVRTLFNPRAPVDLNPRLKAEVEEVRSLILDGNIPRVRFLLCNNGGPWKVPESQAIIDREKFGDRVRFEHVNHDTLVGILRSTEPVQDTIRFVGKSIVEDFNYTRVFLGKVPVTELARLLNAHGDRLLDRNVRRYLGLHGNRVNESIRLTLADESERPNFYFYNNGITLICERFKYNALQSEDQQVRVEGLQIINGGQTSKTVQSAIAQMEIEAALASVYVLVRLYEVPRDSSLSVPMVTYATNSQTPIDLQDLRSGCERQRGIELSMKELGYEYRRQRSGAAASPRDISAGTAAEAVLATWRRRPQQAKFRGGDHFGALYDDIFTRELNAVQVVIAVLLFRVAENKRRRPPAGAPELVSYASCFAAMLMGQYLLADLGIDLAKLDHRNFAAAQVLVEQRGEAYFARATTALEEALKRLYGDQPVSLQRLAATFRRGDLLEFLPP